MKRGYKRYIGCMILAVFVILQVNIFAWVDVPQNIKIGLESIYKDADKITLGSDTNILVGYISGNRFIEEGQLESNTITIMRDYQEYYYIDEVYSTLEQAKEVASLYDGFPVYIEPSLYRVYTLEEHDSTARASANSKRIMISDEMSRVLLIAENDSVPIEFQGTDLDYNYPVTTIGSRAYRGTVSVVNGQSKGLTVVNTVEMQDYLYGVVPSEMVPSWPIEALKAQAVAARSMAIYQYNRHISKGYNLVDTVTSQVYKGVTIEQPSTSRAVDETYGEVVTYNGKIAETLYFSTSGGYTEDAQYVWGSSIPYLVAVPDQHETKPEAAPWTRTITLGEIQKCVQSAGKNIGQVQGVKIVSRTLSGRVSQLDIIGTTGTHTLTQENIRTFFNASNSGALRSRMFKFTPYDNTNIDTTDTSDNLEELTLMSQNNVVQAKLTNTFIMSATDIKEVGEQVAVQSVTDIIEIETKEESTDTNLDENSVIYGDITIYGKGFGHGVGMSQSGARGMAEAGYTYDEILKYYYTGVEIER